MIYKKTAAESGKKQPRAPRKQPAGGSKLPATASKLVFARDGEEDTLSHKVLLSLRNDILSGKLPPGSRLVRRTIAKRLGVSPLPVVEALFRLEMEGLVESVPHAGARVVDLDMEALEGDRILREALECQAARILAEMGPRAPIPELMARAEILDEIERTVGEDRSRKDNDYLFTHFNFHLALTEAAGWNILARHMQGVWFRRIMISIAENKSRYEVPPRWHAQLVEAIATGDPETAETMMRLHVRHSRDRFRQSLKESLKKSQEEWLKRIGALNL